VAGGAITCMIELKDCDAKKHYRGYVDTPIAKIADGTELVFGGGKIKLKSDEWLTIEEVEKCFLAFFDKVPLPDAVHWREIELRERTP
jgi:hypothetical protein